MSKTVHSLYIWTMFIIGVVITAAIFFSGINYYTTPLEERFYNSAHDLFKPTGLMGHGMGIVGSIMMLGGVSIYMLRKRLKKWSRWGLLKHWLELHIFLCSVGPILILYHTAFKFGGIVAVSFWCMVAVAVSGVIGRFIYVLIPRSIEGHAISLTELEKENEKLYQQLHEYHDLNKNLLLKIDEYISEKYSRSYTVGEFFKKITSDYLNNKKLIREVKTGIPNQKHSGGIVSVLRRRLYVTQRISLLTSIQKIFRYWHIIHLPFALVMIIIMFIHVGVAVAFGYTWIF